MVDIPYDILNLLPHNQEISKMIKEGLSKERIVAFIQATGTGKTFNILQLILENPDKKFLYITPYNSIIEYINEIIKEYNLNINNLKFTNYQTLINKNDLELSKLEFDYLVLDEFQHLGAPVWGAVIDKLISFHSNSKIIGMTAYTIRDRGTIYERDMALPEGDELFSDKVVARYDLIDAILDEVLPTPRYKSTHYNLNEYIDIVINRLNKHKEYQDYVDKLTKAKTNINNNQDAQKLIINNIKPQGKYIYFCPFLSENGVNDIDTVMSTTKRYLLNNGYNEEDIIFYKSTSEYPDAELNRTSFYNDTDLNGNKLKNKLRIMFCINQYNEGIHAPNIDGVILGRQTKSDMVFFEQIGRALSIKDNTKLIQELSLLSIKELKDYCKNNNIKLKNNLTKEQIIKEIITPTIIDLTDNYEYMMELVTELKDKKKTYKSSSRNTQRIINVEDIDFDISYLHQNIFELLQNIESTIISYTWEEAYELAKNFYNANNHLNIPRHFKTDNGIIPSEYGFDLGEWLSRNRQSYKNGKLSPEKITKLNNLHIIWKLTLSWEDAYKLAVEYYQNHNDIKIPASYITEDGYHLGNWLALNRTKYRKNLLTKEQIQLLEKLKINWNIIYSFEEAYYLLETYYNHYGNSNIPYNFKTIDGINYDENGYNLYQFVKLQKDKYSRKELSIHQINLLERLNINLERNKKTTLKPLTFDESLLLLRNYYNHYQNLDIKRSFKTFDGINYNENGYPLGNIVSRLRIKYKNNKLTKEQIYLLENIDMIWSNQKNEPKSWNEAYVEAETFYKINGHLLIPATYKTEDEFALGNWIYLQRKNKDKLSEQQIKLLNNIKMIWDLKIDSNKIIELCIKYNIPYKEYQSVLDHISYPEFYSKIRFLLSIDALLIINNKLHPIFTMSDEQLLENYSFTKEELIKNYLPRSKKRGIM